MNSLQAGQQHSSHLPMRHTAGQGVGLGGGDLLLQACETAGRQKLHTWRQPGVLAISGGLHALAGLAVQAGGHQQSRICNQDVVPQGSTTERAYVSRGLLCRQAESCRKARAAPWRFKTTRVFFNVSKTLSGSVPQRLLWIRDCMHRGKVQHGVACWSQSACCRQQFTLPAQGTSCLTMYDTPLSNGQGSTPAGVAMRRLALQQRTPCQLQCASGVIAPVSCALQLVLLVHVDPFKLMYSCCNALRCSSWHAVSHVVFWEAAQPGR